MSQPFTVIATLIARPGQHQALEQLLRALLEPTRAEAGCLQYDLHQDLQRVEAFYMLERWSSEAALQAHDASEHIRQFRARAGELIEDFDLKRLRPLG